MVWAILWPACVVATVVRPSGATDAFGYDGLGNWTTYTNAEGRVYMLRTKLKRYAISKLNVFDRV